MKTKKLTIIMLGLLSLATMSTASTLLANKNILVQDITLDKVSRCQSAPTPMSVLNLHSEDNNTFVNIGMCQYSDGKLNLFVIVSEKTKEIKKK